MLNPLNVKKGLFSKVGKVNFTLGGVGQNLYYKQPFLQSTDCNSSSFLREISYKVNLTDLYKVVGTCYNNEQMEFCPILLKITNKILLKEYNCEYLLQVWNKEGKLVYQRALHIWSISNEFLIYKPMIEDDNSDCYHITNLKNSNATLLIKDPINDPSFNFLAYNDGVLYVANRQLIYLLQCEHDLEPGKQVKREIDIKKINKVNPGLPIHGLFNCKFKVSMFFWKSLVIVAMETEDNQIDFSQLIPQNLGSADFTYTLKQQRELVHRDIRMDGIDRFSYMVDHKNVVYGIALRKSGLIDIYWNMTLVDSPLDNYADDVSCSFETLYIKMETGDIKAISTKAGASVNFEQSINEAEDFDFTGIFYQNIKNHVNLYNSFTLIRTTLYIVHGPFVSLFNIQDNQWLKHCKFQEGNIDCLVKKQTLKGNKSKHEIAVLLENGAIYNNMQTVFFTQHQSEEPVQAARVMLISANHRTGLLPGKIIKTAQDQQRNNWFYIMTKEVKTEKVHLFTLHDNDLYEIEYGLQSDIDEYTNFIPVFCPSQDQYLILQKYTNVFLYRIKIGKPAPTFEEQDSNLGSLVADTAILECLQNLTIAIEGNVHSCISLDINDHIFLVDRLHFYRYQFTTKVSKTYKNQNCVGIYVVDEKFCYTLTQANENRKSGLFLYDINNILKKDNDVSYKLSSGEIGFSGRLDWNQDYSRFSLLKSLDSLVIIPALHRNTIAFIGMSRRDQYLATKLIKDKFIALDKNNYIFCWSIVTGKLLSVTKLPTRQDYSKYRIFKSDIEPEESCPYYRNWFSKVLLVKEEAEKDFDETTFYKEDGMVSQIKHQMQYAQTQKKEFREFKLLEIVSEGEVKEHLVFIHPYYLDQRQRLYFDSKHQYMLEKLNHPRVFLYEREESKLRSRQVRWRCLRRWNKFPEELENDSGYLRVLSPSFQYCIDLDKAANQFVVKDTFTLTEMGKIPKHLMNPDEEKPTDIMNRFKWVSDEVLQLISHEGIETIIDMKENFKEIEYNVIPCFDQDEIKNPLRSYYSNRSPLAVSQVKERLLRKYQNYKSAYYLEHKREPFSLYDELFTVDYQVDKCKGMFVADMSFTFLHWQIMEQLASQNLHIDFIDNSQIELLCYNILPGGDTVLHKLNQNSEAILKIFELAHPNEEDVNEIAFHVPFIQNLQHKSPLHICKEQQDIRTMDTMLGYLAGYGQDHHSRAIADIFPFFVEKQLPNLVPYLDSRLQQTDRLQRITKGCLKEKTTGITEISLLFPQDQFEKKFLKMRTPGDDTLIDRPIKVEFVDIPKIYHYSDDMCNKLFQQLAHTSQLEIFEKKAIQKLIEFNYPLTQEWTRKKLQMPFILNQIILFVYLNFVFGLDNKIANILDLPMQIILGCFSCYFLYFNGFLQVKHDGLNFLKSIWSYINIITPCTILSVLTINSFKIPIGEENERILQAIGVFFMWYKFLYFFRLSKSYGYLTRLIIIVIMDMSTFLVVLFFTIVAFGDTFLTISNGNDNVWQDGVQQVPFVNGFFDAIIYVYLIVLGSFDMTQYTNSIATNLLITFFIVCTVFNTIVMLNLLIAIIGETFSIVKANAENAQFQEMAALMNENSYLIPENVKQNYAQKNKYLMVVTDLDAEIQEESDAVMQRLELIKKQAITKIERINKNLKVIKKHDKQEAHQNEEQELFYQKVVNLLQSIPGITNSTDQNDNKELNSSRILNKLNRSTMWQMPGQNLNSSFSVKKFEELAKRYSMAK